MVPRDGDDDFRWIRPGYFSQGRPVDELVAHLESLLDGDNMPQRWKSSNQQDFVQKYGGGVKWCKTASYHMLIINGWPILRMWTNAKHVAQVEVNNRLAKLLTDEGLSVEAIPEGSKKKRREFEHRTKITLPEELTLIVALVRAMYGLLED